MALLMAAALLALANFWMRPPTLPDGLTWNRYPIDVAKALRDAE